MKLERYKLAAKMRESGATFQQIADATWAPEVLEKLGPAEFVVKSDRQFSRGKPECIGWTVLLEGKFWTIQGVQRFLPGHPISMGEQIGLLVTETRPMKNTDCPWCDKPFSDAPLTFKDCGEYVCKHCGNPFTVYTDEDADCNYWFGVERSTKTAPTPSP